MADNITVISLFTNIANAIRAKTGSSEKIVADNFPYMLASIPDNSVFISILDKTIANIPESYLEGVTSIGTRAFRGCTNLARISLPESVTSIGMFAFTGCVNLATVTFKGTPTSISSFSFNQCTNITTINVPWSNGEVAGAPWGAAKATINYNYIE